MAKKATQPPLPGMGRDAILGKKRVKNLQPTLPGMSKMQKQKAKAEEQAPVEDKKPKKSSLRSELASGNRPMFMTPREIAANVNMGDAGMTWSAHLGQEKSRGQKSTESLLLQKKLRQSKSNPSYSSHWKDSHYTGPTLHESLKDEGFQGTFNIAEGTNGTNSVYMSINDQHHRLAALRNLSPNQFIPVKFNKF